VYYNKPTFTPVNFLRTNLSSVSLFYGANPWHYYFTQAIPILCTTGLPFVLHGIWITLTVPRHNTPSRTMLATILWSIAIYSFGGHKEWRFLHPILPLFHVFAAKSLITICSSNHQGRKVGEKPTYNRSSDLQNSKRRATLARFDLPDIPAMYLCLIFLTLPASLYVVLFYCDAPVSVLSYFRALPSKELTNSTVGFLMPCHSTPGFAYLHRKELTDGGSWALGCEPPLQSVIVIFQSLKKCSNLAPGIKSFRNIKIKAPSFLTLQRGIWKPIFLNPWIHLFPPPRHLRLSRACLRLSRQCPYLDN
jgi:phosphatidylinositol glycan class B